MVHIAIPGATGGAHTVRLFLGKVADDTLDVAKEIIDVLLSARKHELLLLSRRDHPQDESRAGVRWSKTDYRDVDSLASVFEGIDAVLSFIDAMSDPDNIAQRNLIEASVRAGVKRFAPSEWAVSTLDDLPWYASKAAVRKYLADLNKDGKVLEYTFFCPGIFTNYYTYPYPSAKHLNLFELNIDFHKRRALLLEGGESDRVSLTTVQDTAQIVARAIEYEGEWPTVSGINGCELAIADVIAIGEKIRGADSKSHRQVRHEHLKAEDLRQQPPVLKSSWLPTVGHHAAPQNIWQGFVPTLIAGMLLANSAGSMKVSDEWNRLLPDYKFTGVEEFLTREWKGRD